MVLPLVRGSSKEDYVAFSYQTTFVRPALGLGKQRLGFRFTAFQPVRATICWVDLMDLNSDSRGLSDD